MKNSTRASKSIQRPRCTLGPKINYASADDDFKMQAVRVVGMCGIKKNKKTVRTQASRVISAQASKVAIWNSVNIARGIEPKSSASRGARMFRWSHHALRVWLIPKRFHRREERDKQSMHGYNFRFSNQL